MFKLVIFKVLSTWCNTPIRMVFSTAQNNFWTCRFWCLLAFLLFFVSPVRHWSTFPFEDFCHPGNKKKSQWGGGSCHFWSKTAEHSARWGRCTHKSPIMTWANTTKEFSKKKTSLKPNTASHNNASWNTDTDVFLENSPSGGSLYYKVSTLQKIILVFGGFHPLTKLYFGFLNPPIKVWKMTFFLWISSNFKFSLHPLWQASGQRFFVTGKDQIHMRSFTLTPAPNPNRDVI